MSDLKPEEKAREWIDRKLNDAGWNVVDRSDYAPNMTAVAVREAAMQNRLEADYLLLINGKAIGVIEAKRAEIELDNEMLIVQAERYTHKVKNGFPVWENPLPFVYLSNGRSIAFRDCRDPDTRYELVRDFSRPKDLVRKYGLKGEFDGLPHLFKGKLRDCQFDAIRALETSFKKGERRAVMVLATGAGKTFTACMIAYRLLEYTSMNRVLFLVDRNNLGAAAKAELQSFTLTESGKPFSEIFGVEQLTNRPLESRSRVVVSTIQRLYSQLTGDTSAYSEESDDDSFGQVAGEETVELPENPLLPPDFFDLIIIDECHRSIYSEWQKVLTYFKNARLVGMTATPIPETLAFFNDNVVANYTLERSILDGVNVPHRVYRIRTEIGENGGEIKKGETLTVTNRQDKSKHTKTAVADRSFDATQLNRSVMVPDQIRKVLQEYKDAVYTKMFPDREPNFEWLPKTLIFAASEIHAQQIVDIAKEVFGRSDDKFVQRITYSAGDSNALIREFRYSREFRIAVTVTLVATGTDVKPLEVLIFLNDVHSETLYTQMKGRGVRTISPSQLQNVTPNATSKDLFFLIDAVGVTTSEKRVPSLDDKEERPLNPTLAQLLEDLSHFIVPDDSLSLLAAKLSAIGHRADPEELEELATIWPVSPATFAEQIFDALESGKLPPFESSSADNTERMNVIAELINNKPACRKLVEIARGYVKMLQGQKDSVIEAGFSLEEAQKSTQAFEDYVKAHRDDIEALRLIYNQESGKLTAEMIDGLAKTIKESIPGFDVLRQWSDYETLYPERVKQLRPGDERKAVTNLIQIVRFAYGLIGQLYSLTSGVNRQFALWCGQKQRDLEMTDEIRNLFWQVATYISQNGGCSIKRLRVGKRELAEKIKTACGSLAAANEHLFTLTEFILKAA